MEETDSSEYHTCHIAVYIAVDQPALVVLAELAAPGDQLAAAHPQLPVLSVFFWFRGFWRFL